MQIKGIKIGLVALIALLVLTLLLFAHYLWETQGIHKPLLNSIKSIGGVNTVVIEKERRNLLVNVELGPVDNFPLAYKQIEDNVRKNLSKDSYKLEIKDNRNDELTSSFLSLSSYIQEGIQTGKYSLMEEQISSQTKALGLDHSYVLVDAENIYLQLHLKDNYLYEVIPRKQL